MKSQKVTDRLFNTPDGINATDSQNKDIYCYHQPSYMFNRETYQMSPLLFESDTDDTSQSTEIKCYQEKTITPQEAPATQNNLQIFDLMTTLNDLRNEISSQLDASTQHNQCCSETLLNSSQHNTAIEAKTNTNNAYISPSPRVTRAKLLHSRILTRSAKRLHKISEHSEYGESPRNSRKVRNGKDLRKGRRCSSNKKDSKSTAGDKEKQDEMLIESVRKSNVKVVIERLKFPFFQNPHHINGKFIQPNIMPNIQLDDDADNEMDFLNRRLSSEVLMFTEIPAVISLSSESTIQNATTPPPGSPDLFESSPASNLCSQSSYDIPNGQVVMANAERRISETATSTPKPEDDSTLVPSISDLFDCCTPNVNLERQKLLADEDRKVVQPNTFEITVNEVFDNVIHVTDSEETLTPRIENAADATATVAQKVKPQSAGTSDHLDNVFDLTKCPSSQEVTPKKRPEIRGLLNKSVGACPSNSSTTLSRTKWLSKPRSSDDDLVNRSSQRCRRLELWFYNDRKPKKEGRPTNILLSSSEDEDS